MTTSIAEGTPSLESSFKSTTSPPNQFFIMLRKIAFSLLCWLLPQLRHSGEIFYDWYLPSKFLAESESFVSRPNAEIRGHLRSPNLFSAISAYFVQCQENNCFQLTIEKQANSLYYSCCTPATTDFISQTTTLLAASHLEAAPSGGEKSRFLKFSLQAEKFTYLTRKTISDDEKFLI